MVLAFSIYCMAGKVLWQKRKELPGFLNPLNENPFNNIITTEITVTSRPRPQRGLSDTAKPGTPQPGFQKAFSDGSNPSLTEKPQSRFLGGFANTSKPSVLTKPRPMRGFSESSKQPLHFDRIADSNPDDDDFDPYSVNIAVGENEIRGRPSMPDLMRIRALTRTAAVNEMNPEAWLYARTSFLFFLALLITWVRFAPVAFE